MKKVLLIDDDAGIRAVCATALRAYGYEIAEAGSGEEGVALTRALRPDLVLCDYKMGGMDGYETLAALRAEPATCGVPFILMTAVGEIATARRSMNLGADDYLPKPLPLEELVAAVQCRLARREALQHRAEQKLDALRRGIGVSLPHELRTPLNGILGLAEILRTELDSFSAAEVREMLGDICQSAGRLERLVRRFTAYTEAELAAASPATLAAWRAHRTADPAAIVRRVAAEAAQRHGRPGDLALQIDAAPPLAIHPDHFAQLLFEPLDNAFKFSPPGAVVRVDGLPAPAGFAWRIADAGRGLTADQIALVDAFFQFDRGKYEQQGAGLGLGLARQLAENHGGRFEIASAPGRGATCTITLPACP